MLAGSMEVKTDCYRVTVEVVPSIRKYFRNKVKQAQTKQLGEEGSQRSGHCVQAQKIRKRVSSAIRCKALVKEAKTDFEE